VQIQHTLQHWQQDTALAGVRDDQALAKLPRTERAVWQNLWTDVEAVRKQARDSYSETQHKGALTAKQRAQTHAIALSAGRTYVIDLESAQFDTYLRLEDGQGKVLAENQRISPVNQNSRIIFTAPADGTYRIVATSYQQRGTGSYTLTIRVLAGKAP
jgi:hypothetical protein